MNNLEFRNFEEDYLGECANIMYTEMKEFYVKFFPNTTVDDLEMEISDALIDGKVFLLFLSSKLIGFFIYHLYPKKGVLLANELHIKKEFQNRGFGTIVLNYLFKLAKEERFEFMDLYVFKDSRAVSLYEREGYEIVGESLKGNNFIMRKSTNVQTKRVA